MLNWSSNNYTQLVKWYKCAQFFKKVGVPWSIQIVLTTVLIHRSILKGAVIPFFVRGPVIQWFIFKFFKCIAPNWFCNRAPARHLQKKKLGQLKIDNNQNKKCLKAGEKGSDMHDAARNLCWTRRRLVFDFAPYTTGRGGLSGWGWW